MCPAFVRLIPCRQKLWIEAERIETEYNAAKGRCDEAPKISQAVLETLGRVGSMQAKEVRLLLAKKLGMISQRASGLINRTIAKTLTDSGMSLGDMDVGHGTRGASRSNRGVSVVQYHGWVTDTERVARPCSLMASSWEMEISMTNHRNSLLRKLE